MTSVQIIQDQFVLEFARHSFCPVKLLSPISGNNHECQLNGTAYGLQAYLHYFLHSYILQSSVLNLTKLSLSDSYKKKEDTSLCSVLTSPFSGVMEYYIMYLCLLYYHCSDFEDMSCEMIFGQQPPEDDPALKQPCFRTKCKPALRYLYRFNHISSYSSHTLYLIYMQASQSRTVK